MWCVVPTHSVMRATPLDFCCTVIGTARPNNATEAIILGRWSRNEVGQEAALAFIRHAYGKFYDSFSNVDLMEGHEFVWQKVYLDALNSFKSAVVRYAARIRRLYTHRKFAPLPGIVPESARERFEELITIAENGTWTLTSGFETAVTAAAVANDRHTANNPRPPPAYARPRLTPHARRSRTASA